MNESVNTAAFGIQSRPSIAPPTTRGIIGSSFKHEHLPSIMSSGLPDGFFEIHAENYMGAGGPPHRALTVIRQDYPLSIHGVCMSIGGPTALDAAHLARFRDVVARYEPILVSEHLAWSSHGGTFFNDLLPLPYTKETLAIVSAHISQVQEAIKRPILLENPSTYVAFSSSTMSETDFISSVSQRTGCGVLLDLNNVFVSATNHNYPAEAYLAEFPLDKVGEIHLAGYSEQRDDEDELLLIDSHDCCVSDAVWNLYKNVISRIGTTPTLIEWDSNLPDWPILQGQALKSRAILSASQAFVRTGDVHVA
jgi:uncharacterized protein (UPF0276 family)